eukprot:COSAG01_NODE_104_length_26171_cov_96.617612_28_plen_83_part_00
MDTLTGPTPTGRAFALLDHCYLEGPGGQIHCKFLQLTRQVWGENPLAHEHLLRGSPTSLRHVLERERNVLEESERAYSTVAD